MKTMKKLLAGALIAGTALAVGGCKEKKVATNEEVARTRDTDRRIGVGNDRYDDRNKDTTLAAPAPSTAPESGSPVNPPPENDTIANNSTGSPSLNANGTTNTTPRADDSALNTQGIKGSPEIAHTGPQGTAVAPDVAVAPPDNTALGANNPTGPSPVNDQSQGMEMHRATAFGEQGTTTTTTVAKNDKATQEKANQVKDDLNKAENKDIKPSDTDDPQAQREAAYGAAAERLAKLDARVSDIRARVDAMSNKSAFTDTLTDLRKLHETAQSAIDQIRDRNVKLDDARESADRRMTQFEAAINSVQKRIEKAASQT